MLLLVRVILYLVAAVNVSNDPQVALTAITFSMCFIVLLKGSLGNRVYRQWPKDMLEIFFYLNILFLAIFTLYFLAGPNGNQKAVAYISVITTLLVLLLIILYHVYTYTSAFTKLKVTKYGRKFDNFLTGRDPTPKPQQQSPPPDDDIHRFNEVLDMIDRPANTNDYNVPQDQHPVAPTHTVVEVHKPQLARPDREEANGANDNIIYNVTFVPRDADAIQN